MASKKFASRTKLVIASAAAILVIIIAAGVVWFLVKSPLSQIPQKVDVDLTLQGINLVHGEGGQQQWTLNADKADIVQGTESVSLEGVHIQYIVADDNSSLTIVSDHGLIDRTKNTATLWPWVTGLYKNMDLQGRRLFYDGNNKNMTLTDDVTFIGENIEANASVMYMDLTTGLINATGGITAVIYMDEAINSGEGARNGTEQESTAARTSQSGQNVEKSATPRP